VNSLVPKSMLSTASTPVEKRTGRERVCKRRRVCGAIDRTGKERV
jgi:hypothetical protein